MITELCFCFYLRIYLFLCADSVVWRTVEAKGTRPSPRTYHTNSACVKDSVFVFSGGETGATPVTDPQTHVFNTGLFFTKRKRSTLVCVRAAHDEVWLISEIFVCRVSILDSWIHLKDPSFCILVYSKDDKVHFEFEVKIGSRYQVHKGRRQVGLEMCAFLLLGKETA